MCIAFFQFLQNNPIYQFVLSFNREEIIHRQTENLHPWADSPYIYSGTDKEKGGTWLGINTKTGIICFLLNIRIDGKPRDPDALSRGAIVSDLLSASSFEECLIFCQKLSTTYHLYNPFHLILIELNKAQIYYFNPKKSEFLQNELLYGISNSFMDAPYLRIPHGICKFKKIVDDILDDKCENIEENLVSNLMANSESCTGIQTDIFSKVYNEPTKNFTWGTCSTTTILLKKNGDIFLKERDYRDKYEGGKVQSYVYEINRSLNCKETTSPAISSEIKFELANPKIQVTLCAIKLICTSQIQRFTISYHFKFILFSRSKQNAEPELMKTKQTCTQKFKNS